MHIIRLRSAWEPSTVNTSGATRLRFERPFGKPTNLSSERVVLVIEPAPKASVGLNGQPLESSVLAATGVYRIDITALLNHRNRLSIEADSAAFEHEVWLEIVE